MTKKISFIHAADLHLDSPFQGFTKTPESIFQTIQESTFIALQNLVKTAIRKKVDFVLLVGDLFDNERQSLKAQIHLRRAFEQLYEHNIAVYLSYGNHDHMNGNIHSITYPDNVFIFQEEQVTEFIYTRKGKELAVIQGFSYENRAVKESKVHDYKVGNSNIPFQIATLHGSIQTNKEHDLYAPFKLSDLVNKGFDYWALGHIHKREVLKKDPMIVYPGNTQGRNRKEQGEKGCYYVEMSEIETEISFIPLQAIEFFTLNIDISECKEIHQIELALQEKLNLLHTDDIPKLIELSIQTDHFEHKSWEVNGYLDEIIEIVNESKTHTDDWIYIYRYDLNLKHSPSEDRYKGDHFIGELTNHINESPVHPLLVELFNHRQGRKYLESFTDQEIEGIKNKAHQLLIEELFKDGRGIT